MAQRSSRTRLGNLLRSSKSQEAVLDQLLEASVDEEHPERLLSELEQSATALKLEAADRSYRLGWTENYRRLFPDLTARSYKTELVNAFITFPGKICVTGEAFDFSHFCRHKASLARLSFENLKMLLKDWASSSMFSTTPAVRLYLHNFDRAFADFEQVYIQELIAIERKCREPLAIAIELDRELRKLEDASKQGPPSFHRDAPVAPEHETLLSTSPRHQRQCSEDGRRREASGELSFGSLTSSKADVQCLAASAMGKQRQEALKQLIEQVSLLNTCANPRGRGRGDLTIDVLKAAAEAFLERSAPSRREQAARQLLAWRVLDAFAKLREYLVSLDGHLHCVEPQLSHNEGLVDGLTAWEEAWELGARFLLKPGILSALSGVAAKTAEVESFCPDLRKLLEEQDADVFLIVPRLVLLSSLIHPGLAALPALLLPQHFGASEEVDFQLPGGLEPPATAKQSQQLQDLAGLFENVKSLGLSAEEAWEALARCAVAGPGQQPSREFGQDVLDDFMRRLEALSMELQRKKPEEWNLCCSILLQCTEAASRVNGA